MSTLLERLLGILICLGFLLEEYRYVDLWGAPQFKGAQRAGPNISMALVQDTF